MKITKTEEHGLRLVVTMVKENRQLTISELSRIEGMTEALIAKLLGMLRRGGIVKAERGRKGGYEIAQDPATITMRQAMAALGPVYSRGCTDPKGDKQSSCCAHIEECPLRAVWEHLEVYMDSVLNRVTLADLARQEGDMAAHLKSIESEFTRPGL